MVVDTAEQEKLVAATAIAADKLHADWQKEHFKQKGEGTPRWKDMKESSVQWVTNRPDQGIYAGAVQEVDGKHQINIAALPNSALPPQFSGENTAAAVGAIQAVLTLADIEERSALVHDQWLSRNDSWASAELKVPYAQLAESEKEKDRVIVRVAESALKQVGLLPTTIPGSHATTKNPENGKA